MNLLKISTCVLCLGTVLGVSAMAMEEKSEKCQQNVSKQVQTLATNKKKEEKSDRYLKFYNDLITKGKLIEPDAREQAEIFEEKLTEGKSFIYAQYYSMLMVMRGMDAERAMFQAEVFEREFKTEKDFRKADYYATIIIPYNLKAMRMAYLEKEIRSSELINKDDKFIQRALKIAKREVEFGRSCFYVRRYVDLIIDNVMEKTARRLAETVDIEMKEGGSYYYASAYAMLKLINSPEDKMRRKLKVIYKELKSGKGFNYAMRYAELILDEGLPEDRARKNAELVEKEIGASIKNYFYGTRFADLMGSGYVSEAEARMAARKTVSEADSKGNNTEYLRAYSNSIANGNTEVVARKKAEIVEKLTSQFKGYEYASVYAEAVVDFKQPKDVAERWASLAMKELKAGKSRCYAMHYGKLTAVCRRKDEYARKEAEIFESMFDRKKHNGCFVEAYAELVTELKLSDDMARRVASLAENEMKSGKPYWRSLYYAKLVILNKEEESHAKSEAAIVDKETDRGKGLNYAKRYARLLLRGVAEKEARKGAEELEKITKEFKRYYYAEKYLDLISAGVPEGIAARQAEIYYQDKKAKGYCLE